MKTTLLKSKSTLKKSLQINPFHLSISINTPKSIKFFRQTNDLNDLVETAKQEEKQRKAKFVEYTQKVYKPSKKITYNREGELLLYTYNNIKEAQVYLKYPYVMYDLMIPLAFYNFFVDPFGMSWQFRHGIFYAFGLFGWFPHYLYIKNLTKHIHQVFLLRGGKYCRVVLTEISGAELVSWITIDELRLINKDFNRYDNSYDFISKDGQLKHSLAVEFDYFILNGAVVNNESFYLKKKGIVHQPEIFEQVMRGYNIDDTDYEINTEDNVRWLEPNHNV